LLLETMQVGIKFTISFIWHLGYLVEIPQWEGGRDIKHPWSTTQHLEHSRKQPKKWLCNYWWGSPWK
jgi:hypothetical protein